MNALSSQEVKCASRQIVESKPSRPKRCYLAQIAGSGSVLSSAITFLLQGAYQLGFLADL